jgi:hypothetical protein
MKKNPGKKRDFELYQKTFLKPDESLLFPDLDKLKKHKTILFISARNILYTGIAAAVLLIALLVFVFRRSPESDLITSTIPAKKDAIKTIENVAQQNRNEEIPSIKTNVIKESLIQPLKDNHMNSDKNSIIQTAFSSDIEEIRTPLKPILIQRIVNVIYPSELGLLKQDKPVQSYTEPPVQPNNSLAEFIKERFSAAKIIKSAENLDVWTLAQASLKGINYLTESDIQISRKLDSNGDMLELSIESESFGFSTPLKKQHPL